RAEVQRDGFLPPVQVLEVEPVTVAAHAIARASTGHLDLDRPGAPVCELPDTGWPRPRPREVEHREARQGEGAVVCHDAGGTRCPACVSRAPIATGRASLKHSTNLAKRPPRPDSGS